MLLFLQEEITVVVEINFWQNKKNHQINEVLFKKKYDQAFGLVAIIISRCLDSELKKGRGMLGFLLQLEMLRYF